MSEQHCEKSPTCPYCDESIEDWYEIIDPDEESQEIECQSCGKTFGVNINREIDFTSYCIEEHKYKDTPGIKHKDMVTCEICGDVNFKKYI